MSVTKPINICGKKDCSDSNDCVGPLTEITSSFQSVFKNTVSVFLQKERR